MTAGDPIRRDGEVAVFTFDNPPVNALSQPVRATLLAAFDVEAVRESLGRMPRVLFIAHRSELLEQAAAAFRRTFPDARFGWFAADRSDTKGDVIFAATGVTDGSLLDGVKRRKSCMTTDSVVMRASSGTVRWVRGEHRNEPGRH